MEGPATNDSFVNGPQETDQKVQSKVGSDDEESLYYEDSIAGDYVEQEEDFPREEHSPAGMSTQDLKIYRALDREYELAVEERDVTYHARYQSVRETACCAVFIMAFFLAMAVFFFEGQTEEWDAADALLFSVYAMTTVGYGHLHNPQTPAFQLYVIFFILVGIALLTILVAQIYQCIALEASRAQHSYDNKEALGRLLTRTGSQPGGAGVWIAHHHRYTTTGRLRGQPVPSHSRRTAAVAQIGDMLNVPTHMMEKLFKWAEKLEVFLKENEIGRGISVLFPFCSLIAVGATVVGIIEEWTVIESLYFSVVSLTTVGFGDYYPTRSASVWFCVFWLPFSIGFMSLYLTNVAAFYIRMSDKNVNRIERQLRKRVLRAKRRVEREKKAARDRALRGQQWKDTGSAESTEPEERTASMQESISEPMNRNGFDTLPVSDSPRSKAKKTVHPKRLFGSRGGESNRRERIIRSSQMLTDDSEDRSGTSTATITSMKAVLDRVRSNLDGNPSLNSVGTVEGAADYFSIRSAETVQNPFRSSRGKVVRKPSFGLRALVQERLAQIVATDVAGYQSGLEIQDHTLSITIDSLRSTAERWKIPRRARKAFRAVAFEVLYFVGEYGLVTRGVDAVLELPPLVFQGLFAPLLAALGDAEEMQSWLIRTEVLADVDLKAPSEREKHIDEGTNQLQAPRLELT